MPDRRHALVHGDAFRDMEQAASRYPWEAPMIRLDGPASAATEGPRPGIVDTCILDTLTHERWEEQ